VSRGVRLDRLLANLGYGSRREAQGLVARGAVVLDGQPLRDPGQHVPLDPGLTARLTVEGAPLDPPPPLTLILHKPLGVVCSHREAGRSVYELLPPRWREREPTLSTVGRLDAETTGLLLITDDCCTGSSRRAAMWPSATSPSWRGPWKATKPSCSPPAP
jgi:16S rRNA pseudouridine516 synthase